MKSKSCLTEKSQQLRRNMTKEERRLWYDFLKGLPITFNRQKVIGQYIVDFYCASAGVVEIDGSQHYENIGKENDRVRDEYMKSHDIMLFSARHCVGRHVLMPPLIRFCTRYRRRFNPSVTATPCHLP